MPHVEDEDEELKSVDINELAESEYSNLPSFLRGFLMGVVDRKNKSKNLKSTE